MRKLTITIDGYTFEVELSEMPENGSGFLVMVNGEPVRLLEPEPAARTGQAEWYLVDERPREVLIDPALHWIQSRSGIHSLEIQDLDSEVSRPQTGDGRIKAPIPGKISQVMAVPGEDVQVGQPLLVLEAMKMENEIRAPRSGVLKILKVVPGQRVSLHEVLAEID
jgi:biotin carboxyl carrier protein